MAINVARFEYAETVQWGVVKGNRVLPIETKAVTTGELIQNTTIEQLKGISGDGIPWQDIKLMSPVTRNQQFVCQGANYRQHMIESGIDPDIKQFNMIFTKSQSCIVAADSPVIIPKQVRFLDYEVELGLVLRKEIRQPLRLTSNELPQYIAGLVVVNDYSARDVQIPEMQLYKGKSFRTFGPVGPWLPVQPTPVQPVPAVSTGARGVWHAGSRRGPGRFRRSGRHTSPPPDPPFRRSRPYRG